MRDIQTNQEASAKAPRTLSNQHTPGPWTARPFFTPEREDDPLGTYIIEPAATKLGEQYDMTAGEDDLLEAVHAENNANAALIASAPELLEALEHALKETASAFNPCPEDEALTVTMCRATIQHLHNEIKGAISKATGGAK